MDIGSEYFIKCTGVVDLFRNDQGASFPYTYPGFLSVTGTNAGDDGYYYFFYDWEIKKSCELTPGVEVKGVIGGPTPVVSYDNIILSTTPGATSYQWYLDGNLIAGAIYDTLTPPGGVGGSYTVEVTDAGCTGTSDPYVLTSMDEIIPVVVDIFPNPGTDVFQIRMEQGRGQVGVKVYNAIGQLLYSKEYKASSNLRTINLTDQPGGVYLLQLTLDDQIATRRLIKH